MIKKIIFLFLAWRLFLLFPLILASNLLTNRQGYEYTLLTYFLGPENKLLSHFLLNPFGNFDAVYYLIIAARGYTVEGGFFPLFPLSIFFTSAIFGKVLELDITQYFASLGLVAIYFFISLILMYKLIRMDYKESIVLWSIIFMLVFPTSFFFAAIYSESLFLLLSLGAFYFARKKNWFLAGLFGGLLTATRIVGIAILPALIYEFIKYEKQKSKIKTLSLFLIPMGLISYMIFNFFKWGNMFYFISAQGNFQNNRSVDAIIFFPQTIFRYLKIFQTISLTQYEWWVAFIEFSAFIFGSFMIYIAWKKKVRLSYLIFTITAFLIPISTGTFSGLPRYILPLFPIFIALALLKNKTPKFIYCIVSFMLLMIFFALFSKGYFIA
ncbi:MAG: hypothetical protein HYT07_03225 [Candidatus Levybacteria bacterium]|nr:hypothetical protein [Candidatus Levybacteria bacterium]